MKTAEHFTKERLAAYACDSLRASEAEAVERHLLVCAACRDLMPAPTPEQFWSALLADKPARAENLPSENPFPAASPLQTVFSFFRQPAVLGVCALILVATFSFVIWLGRSESLKHAASEQDVAQMTQTPKKAESPNAENNLPTVEQPSVATGDEIQKVENQRKVQPPQPRPNRENNNLMNASENRNKPSITEDRELAMLLEKTPPTVSSLSPNASTLRRSGDNENKQISNAAPTFALLAPVGETTLETAPVFRWQIAANAVSYRISILDEDFNEVLTAEVSTNRFKTDKPLKRGAKYLWRVAAQTVDGEIVAPQPPQPPAVFRVAAETVESRIASLNRNGNDRLKLAVFYASEGMLNSAHCTLREILARKPKDKAARRLLVRVERWKKENNATAQRCGPSTATNADQ